MPIKQIYYDARSINPSIGDKVAIVINRLGAEAPEVIEAIYLGSVQMESYTTPYFKFLVANKSVRLICSNDVREFQYTIETPDLDLPKLDVPHSDDRSREGGY